MAQPPIDLTDVIFDTPNIHMGGPRVDLKPEQFDLLLQQKGYRVTWEQAMFCSCYSRSGQPNYECETCHGLGYVYFNPTETRIAVASIAGNKQQDRIGLNDVGYAYATTKTTDLIGFRDRFTFTDFTTRFSEVIERQPLGISDTLRYPVTSINCVRQLDSTYSLGVDFIVDPDNPRKLKWLTEEVTPGDYYSILYITKPVYIVINIEHEIRGSWVVYHALGGERFVTLPKKYQLKREDFLHEPTR